MQRQFRNGFLMILLTCGVGTPAASSSDPVRVTSGADSRHVKVTINNPGKRCGVRIEFGDGTGTNRIIDRRKTVEVSHVYIDVGNHTVTVEGRSLSDTTTFTERTRVHEGCELNAERQISVKPGDYVVLAQPGWFDSVTTLDGRTRLTLSADVAPDRRLLVCYVPSALYPAPMLDSIVDPLREEMRLFYSGLAQPNQLDSTVVVVDFRTMRETHEEASWYEDDWRIGAGYCGLVIVQPAFVNLINSTKMHETGSSYVDVGRIQFAKIHEAATQQFENVKREHAERDRAYAERLTYFAQLVSENSQDTIGSLTLGLPSERGAVSFCTSSHEEVAALAVSEYARLGLATQSDAFQAKAEELGASPDPRRPFKRTFSNAEEFYREWQRAPSECVIYVDVPAALSQIATAIQRDFDTAVVVNELVSVPKLQDNYAKREGYRSYADLLGAKKRMKAMKVDERQYRALSRYAIEDKSSMDGAFREMHESGYSDAESVSVLLVYLADRDEAAGVRGATASSVRDQRNRRLRESAIAAREAELEFERQFPYVAVLTCGMPGMRHLNIYPCFSSGPSLTLLNVRNGREITNYNAINLSDAGEIRADGLHIDLRNSFGVAAQNGDDTLLLGLKIIERSSGRVVHESYATRFRTVKAER